MEQPQMAWSYFLAKSEPFAVHTFPIRKIRVIRGSNL
jgi:hypothetical protein